MSWGEPFATLLNLEADLEDMRCAVRCADEAVAATAAELERVEAERDEYRECLAAANREAARLADELRDEEEEYEKVCQENTELEGRLLEMFEKRDLQQTAFIANLEAQIEELRHRLRGGAQPTHRFAGAIKLDGELVQLYVEA